MLQLWEEIKDTFSSYPFLPAIMAMLFKHDRYLPELTWSEHSWTHNIFRLYEKLFWRRFGIKPELSALAYNKDGKTFVTYQVHSFEAACALTEQFIRQSLSFKFWVPVKLWLPRLSSPNGLPNMASPFLFAIAFDTSTGPNDVSSSLTLTFAHTCTGSNLLLWVLLIRSNARTISSVKYNTVALTRANTVFNGSNNTADLYNLINPATGANNVVATQDSTATSMEGFSASYSGCLQSGVPDATNTFGPTTTTSFSNSLTTIANNCWIIYAGQTINGSALTAGTNTTIRKQDNVFLTGFLCDTNAAQTPAGSKTMAVSSASQSFVGIMASFAPIGATTTSTTITTSTTTTSSSTSTSSTTTSSSTSSSSTTTSSSTTSSTSSSTSSSISTTTTLTPVSGRGLTRTKKFNLSKVTRSHTRR